RLWTCSGIATPGANSVIPLVTPSPSAFHEPTRGYVTTPVPRGTGAMSARRRTRRSRRPGSMRAKITGGGGERGGPPIPAHHPALSQADGSVVGLGLADATEHGFRVDVLGQVADRHDPEQALLVGADQDAADRVVAHEQGGRLDGGLRAHGHEVPAHDL